MASLKSIGDESQQTIERENTVLSDAFDVLEQSPRWRNEKEQIMQEELNVLK